MQYENFTDIMKDSDNYVYGFIGAINLWISAQGVSEWINVGIGALSFIGLGINILIKTKKLKK